MALEFPRVAWVPRDGTRVALRSPRVVQVPRGGTGVALRSSGMARVPQIPRGGTGVALGSTGVAQVPQVPSSGIRVALVPFCIPKAGAGCPLVPSCPHGWHGVSPTSLSPGMAQGVPGPPEVPMSPTSGPHIPPLVLHVPPPAPQPCPTRPLSPQDILEGGNLWTALQELQQIMVTPIKAFRPPPAAPPSNGTSDGAPPGTADAFAPHPAADAEAPAAPVPDGDIPGQFTRVMGKGETQGIAGGGSQVAGGGYGSPLTPPLPQCAPSCWCRGRTRRTSPVTSSSSRSA